MAAAVLLLLFPAVSQARTLKLLVFGDSLTAGYGLAQPDAFQAQLGAALHADGRDVQILDGGVSGDTTAGARSRLDWVLADKPDAAIVEFGGNDGLRGTDPHEMEANLTAILDAFAARHIPTLLTGMFAPPNLGAAYAGQFRAVFTNLGKRPGLMYDPFFLAGVAGDPSFNQADHIHPNATGVKIIVTRLKPLIEKLLDEVPPG
jgi:acyl-CoA thioesterase I